MSSNIAPDFSKLTDTFQSLIGNKELMYQIFDALPIPIEIFGADGIAVYANRAGFEMVGITDPSLHIGIYNLWTNPACLSIFGQDIMDSIFRGESVTFPDFPAPIQDVADRGVIDEKPWEAATMDLYFQPVWDDGKFICTICFFIVKNMYHERAEIVRAKKYIEANWREDFNINAIAKAAHMSSSHLKTLFKQSTDMTLNDYYKKCKIGHIKEKLADKKLSVKEAFAACGEDYRGTCLTVFKKVTGMTPTEYRESLK